MRIANKHTRAPPWRLKHCVCCCPASIPASPGAFTIKASHCLSVSLLWSRQEVLSEFLTAASLWNRAGIPTVSLTPVWYVSWVKVTRLQVLTARWFTPGHVCLQLAHLSVLNRKSFGRISGCARWPVYIRQVSKIQRFTSDAFLFCGKRDAKYCQCFDYCNTSNFCFYSKMKGKEELLFFTRATAEPNAAGCRWNLLQHCLNIERS